MAAFRLRLTLSAPLLGRESPESASLRAAHLAHGRSGDVGGNGENALLKCPHQAFVHVHWKRGWDGRGVIHRADRRLCPAFRAWRTLATGSYATVPPLCK